MQATIPVGPLRALAKMANTVAQANSAVPSHGYVHLEAKRNTGPRAAKDPNPRLVVQAFDGDVHWIASDGGGISQVETPGVAVVRADQFYRLVGALGAHDVELHLDGAHLVVRSGRSRNRLAVLPPAEFPRMDLKMADGTRAGGMAAQHLQRVLRSLGGACSPETKAIINCLRLESLDGGLVEASATDGYRAGQLRVPGDVGDVPVMLSARQRQVLTSYLAGLGEEDDVSIACDGRVMAFSKGVANFLHCRLMAEPEKFPPVSKIMPSEHTATLEVATDSFKAAIGRAMLVAKDETSINKLRLSATAEGLGIDASTQFGCADEEVEGTWDEALKAAMSVNGSYLLDGLANMPERVLVRFTTPKHPVLLEGVVGADEPPLRMVLMPMVSK